VVITDPEPYPVAYLRVPGGRLVKKENWVRPGQDELREMLGLNTEEGGYEGLDESGRELLRDLRAEVRENPKSSGNAGLEVEFSSLTIEADQEGETVRFNKGGQWFGASISGSTRAGESIGDELRRCFDALKGKPLGLPPLLISRNTILPRLVIGTTCFPHHPAPTFHVSFRTRQRRLLDLFRYFPTISSDGGGTSSFRMSNTFGNCRI
jgi:hypothetical protein